MTTLHYLAHRVLFALAALLMTVWQPLYAAQGATQAGIRTDLVAAELIALGSAQPGADVPVAVRFRIAPGWHLYWTMPGDSGMPPKVSWTLPPGWLASPLRFPVPERIETAGLVSYTYHDELVLFTSVQVPATAQPGAVELPAKLSWLVCAEACLPGSAQHTLIVNVGAAAPPAPAWLAAAQAKMPTEVPATATITAQRADDRHLDLRLAGATAAATAHVFIAEDGVVSLAEPQRRSDGDATVWRIAVAEGAEMPARISGIISGIGSGVSFSAEVATTAGAPATTPVAAATTTAAATAAKPAPTSFLSALLAGFVGGLILNLMPCVLPVLTLKALALTKLSTQRSAVVRGALFYSVGVIGTVLLLAGVLLALRAGGAQLGWGFQLQEPWVVLALTVLFVLTACNLAGMFEIGLAATRAGSSAQAGHGPMASFWNGVLTTVVATPCGAPFASAAFGYALLAPATNAVAVFAALGAGLALPMLLIALVPGAAKLLPKPGDWMVELKKLLALPMLGAAGWMAWTFVQLAGPEAAFVLLVMLLPAVGWLALAWGRQQQGNPRGWIGLAIAAVAVLGLGWWTLTQPAPKTATASVDATWQPWSPQRQADLLAKRTPMLIDATAAWCLTCQVNKRTTLRQTQVMDDAARRGITLLSADFTNRDPALATELARHGRLSVPTYILYDAQGTPTLLPDLLTPELVLNAFAQAAPTPSTK